MMRTVRAWKRLVRDPAWASALSALAFLAVVATAAPPPKPPRDPIADAIRRILAGRAAAIDRAPGESLLDRAALRTFYERRDYAPVWLDSARAADHARALQQLEDDGLSAALYHGAAFDRLAERTGDAESAAALDVLRTDALLAAARDLGRGRIDPRALHAGWTAPRRGFEPADVLGQLASGARATDILAAYRPAGAEYALLRAALARYRRLPGWPSVEGGRLARGDSAAAVSALRRRLSAEGADLGESPLFDATLEAAVRTWQAARGLEPDGIVGPKTHAALRVGPDERVRQLGLALERLRWEDADRAGLRVRVRVPAFDLRAFDGGRRVLAMKVIAGRADWPTPVFDATIQAVVLSPYWNVPGRIAALEVLPAVRRDRGYLSENHMKILDARGRIVDPSAIDWSAARAGSFPYRFRQEPGPDNPLGGIKFLLPNRYDVYLHDTPARSLFARADRALSHGCVRLERPLALAELLLDGRWDGDRIRAGIAERRPREVPLEQPVPVSIRYTTAWVDDEGVANFRDDLYGHDGRLDAALTRGVAVADAAAGTGCGDAS